MFDALSAFFPCRRVAPANGWSPEVPLAKRPQQKPHTQPGPLTAGQIEVLRHMPVFAEMEAKRAAADKVITKMVEGDLYQ